MVKICNKCGAYNSDDKMFCIDCNEKLGDKISAEQENKIHNATDITIEKLHNSKDPLYIGKLDKIFGFASLAGILVHIILLIFFNSTYEDIRFLWVGIIFFTFSAIEAFVPKFTWTIERMRLSLFIKDAEDAEPSEFYIVCRKVAIIVMFAIGAIILATNLIVIGR